MAVGGIGLPFGALICRPASVRKFSSICKVVTELAMARHRQFDGKEVDTHDERSSTPQVSTAGLDTGIAS